jgi:hypothetical protein
MNKKCLRAVQQTEYESFYEILKGFNFYIRRPLACGGRTSQILPETKFGAAKDRILNG